MHFLAAAMLVGKRMPTGPFCHTEHPIEKSPTSLTVIPLLYPLVQTTSNFVQTVRKAIQDRQYQNLGEIDYNLHYHTFDEVI